jgi:hypothetical protein
LLGLAWLGLCWKMPVLCCAVAYVLWWSARCCVALLEATDCIASTAFWKLRQNTGFPHSAQKLILSWRSCLACPAAPGHVQAPLVSTYCTQQHWQAWGPQKATTIRVDRLECGSNDKPKRMQEQRNKEVCMYRRQAQRASQICDLVLIAAKCVRCGSRDRANV